MVGGVAKVQKVAKTTGAAAVTDEAAIRSTDEAVIRSMVVTGIAVVPGVARGTEAKATDAPAVIEGRVITGDAVVAVDAVVVVVAVVTGQGVATAATVAPGDAVTAEGPNLLATAEGNNCQRSRQAQSSTPVDVDKAGEMERGADADQRARNDQQPTSAFKRLQSPNSQSTVCWFCERQIAFANKRGPVLDDADSASYGAKVAEEPGGSA